MLYTSLMKIFIGADHRGFRLKEQLKVLLEEQGYEVVDGGNTVHDPDDDYPDFVLNIAKQLQKAPEASRGILICGSGVGVDIAANKFAKIRSVLATNPEQAAEAREHENVNVVSLSADHISLDEAQKIIKNFLNTDFPLVERHVRRLKKIEKIENDTK